MPFDTESRILGLATLPYAGAWPTSDSAEGIAEAGRLSCCTTVGGTLAGGEKCHNCTYLPCSQPSASYTTVWPLHPSSNLTHLPSTGASAVGSDPGSGQQGLPVKSSVDSFTDRSAENPSALIRL